MIAASGFDTSRSFDVDCKHPFNNLQFDINRGLNLELNCKSGRRVKSLSIMITFRGERKPKTMPWSMNSEIYSFEDKSVIRGVRD